VAGVHTVSLHSHEQDLGMDGGNIKMTLKGTVGCEDKDSRLIWLRSGASGRLLRTR
jgi:hypothetical protein